MDELRDREVSGYYLMAFLLPVVAGMLILTAVEWISTRPLASR